MQTITRVEAKAQGLKRYFTGQTCVHGHTDERYVVNGECVVCRYEKTKHGYQKNPEYWLERFRQPQFRNRKNKARRENPEYDRTYTKTYREENPDKLKKWLRDYYLKNRKRLIEASKKWKEDHPEEARLSGAVAAHRRRARKRKNGGSHTKQDLLDVMELQKHRCVYCDADLRKVKPHLDHIIPLAKGGSNNRSNLQWLCVTCNETKHTMDHCEFVNFSRTTIRYGRAIPRVPAD